MATKKKLEKRKAVILSYQFTGLHNVLIPAFEEAGYSTFAAQHINHSPEENIKNADTLITEAKKEPFTVVGAAILLPCPITDTINDQSMYLYLKLKENFPDVPILIFSFFSDNQPQKIIEFLAEKRMDLPFFCHVPEDAENTIRIFNEMLRGRLQRGISPGERGVKSLLSELVLLLDNVDCIIRILEKLGWEPKICSRVLTKIKNRKLTNIILEKTRNHHLILEALKQVKDDLQKGEENLLHWLEDMDYNPEVVSSALEELKNRLNPPPLH